MSQILIISDDSEGLRVLQTLLEAEGHGILAALNGTEALEIAQRELPDLIISDIQLPGMDGLQVCQQLKTSECTRDIPIILAVALAETQAQNTGFKLGAADYITRPFEATEVLARVRTHLTLRALRQELRVQDARLRQTNDEHQQAEEALRLSEEKLRALVENINDVIFSLDTQGRFTYISPAIERVARYEANEVLGQSFTRFVHPDDLPDLQVSFERTLDGNLGQSEFRVLAKDGAVLCVRTSSRALWEGGRSIGVTGTMTDITERKRAEETVRDSEARYREALAQTQAALTETQALYHVAHALIASENLAGLLRAVVDRAAETLAADRVSLITLDLQERQITHFVRGGPGVEHALIVPFDELLGGLTGWVLREMKPALSPKEQPDPRESPLAQRRRVETDCGAIIVVPLSYQGKTLGTMTAINRPDEREFTQRDVDLMTAIASQAAAAIENARLHEELQVAFTGLEQRVEERTIELSRVNRMLRILSECNQSVIRATEETALLHDICHLIVDLGGYPLVWVGFAELDSAKTVRPVACQGFEEGYLDTITVTWADTEQGQGPTGTAIRSGKPCIATHIQTDPHFAPWREDVIRRGYASSIALPLAGNERVFGALNIYAAKPDAFSTQEVDLLMELSGDLAYGITSLRERAARNRAEEELQRKRETAAHFSSQLATLQEVTNLLSKAESSDKLCQRAVQFGLSRLGFDRVSIWFFDEHHEMMLGSYGTDEHGAVRDERDARVEFRHEGLAWLIFSQKNPAAYSEHCSLSDHRDQEVGEGDLAAGALWNGNEVIGVIFVDNLLHHQPITEQQLEILRLYATTLGHLLSLKRTEEALRRAHDELEERVEQRTTELKRANAQLAALYQVAQTITSPLQLKVVLDAIVHSTVELLGTDTGVILLVDEAGTGLTIQGAYGLSEKVVAETRDRVGESIAGRVVQTGQPIIANDLSNDLRFYNPSAAAEGLLACASVPLRSGEKIIGTLDVHSKTNRHAFGEEHIQVLNMLASQAVIAIENARLHEQLQLAHAELEERVQQRTAELVDSNTRLHQRQHELESLLTTSRDLSSILDLDELLSLIARRATSLLEADECTIFRLEEEQGTLRPILALGDHVDERMAVVLDIGQGFTGYSIAHRQPFLVNDAQNDPRGMRILGTPNEPEHIMVCPLLFRDHITGAMLVNRSSKHPFTEENLNVFVGFADQVAVAIENARLFTAQHDQRTLAEALRDSAAALSSTLDLDDVLERILTNVEHVVPHDAANIMLIEDGIARVARARGWTERGLGEYIVNLCLAVNKVPDWQQLLSTSTPKPYLIADTHDCPDWSVVPEDRWIRSTAKAPICIGGQLIGILHLDSATPGFFTQRHLDRLKSFADQAAIAIKNARLFAAEHDQRTLAEALRDSAAAISSTLDLDDVLERILTNVEHVVPHDAANIMLIEDGIARVARAHGWAERGLGDWINNVRYVVDEVPNWRRLLNAGSPTPFTIADIHADPDWKMSQEDRWIRSTAKVPIFIGGQLIGILHLDSATPGFFTQQHLDRLGSFADQAAIAIQNAQLYQKLEAYSMNLEAMVEARTAELRQINERVETILNNSPDAILLLSVDGTIRQVNPTTCDLFSCQAEDVFRQSPSMLISPGSVEKFNHALKLALTEGQTSRLEITAQRINGTRFDADVALAPVKEEGVTGIVCSVRDISELKEVERMKDGFVSNVSHELRTPITNLKLYQRLLVARPDKSDQYLAVIRRETDRLSRIIDDLLTLSRIDQGRTELRLSPVDLNVLARQYVEDRTLLAQNRELTLNLIEAPDLSPVQADEGLLGQVLSIMLTNALNYTPSGGQVTVSVRTDQVAGRSWAGLAVSDTGPGILIEEQSHLFERFFRGTGGRESGAPGTGLGLAILKEIVTRHLGRVEVTSEGIPGKGATFTVWLPFES